VNFLKQKKGEKYEAPNLYDKNIIETFYRAYQGYVNFVLLSFVVV